MNEKLLTVLLVAIIPSLSFGQGSQNYQCSYGDLQRRVEVLYETGMTLPCEVQYYKDTEAPGEMQVLWRAMNEAGYCERKAEAFIAKFVEAGWNCGQNDDAVENAEPQPVDDTEALIAVEEADMPAAESESTE